MKKIKVTKKMTLIVFTCCLVAAGALYLGLKGQVCQTQSGSVVGYAGGDPSTIFAMDGVSNDLSLMVLRLKGKGANFVPSSNYPVTTNYRMSAAAADFNGDGLVDLVQGGQQTDYNTDSSLGNTNRFDSNVSIFISRGRDPQDNTKFYFPSPSPYYILYNPNDSTSGIRTYRMFAMGAGDVDGDGDNDILALAWSGKLYRFKNLYKENNLTPGGAPVFNATPTLIMNVVGDGLGEFSNTSMGQTGHRKTSGISVADIDKDGDKDLIVSLPTNTGIYGQVVILINNGVGQFSRKPTTINPYGTVAYGVCGAEAGDFNMDGSIDFIVASVHSRDIFFYKNDGLGNFKKVTQAAAQIPLNHGSPEYFRAGDFDGDGLVDFAVGTDAYVLTPTGHGGFVYWYRNNGQAQFTGTCLSSPSCSTPTSPSNDLDSGAVGDFDNDGAIDFFVADGNDSQRVYFFMNLIFPLYVARGTVSSRNLLPCSFITSDFAVVSATLTAVDNKPASTNITYYLSNSDDESGNPRWEGPVTSGVEFSFESPGVFLRWQAVLESSVETSTPKIYSVNISYKYITKREYSRTSHALTQAEVDTGRAGDEDVLYSASFEFPTWKGHFRSWDVTNLSLPYSRSSDLQKIEDAGATNVMDAGEILAARTWDSRIVYTAYDAESDGLMNDRTDFTVANTSLLEPFLGLGLNSPESDALIKFVLGENRVWKLGDINHSAPQVLEPPGGISALMGTGYAEFKEAQKNRRRVVLVGANDGMLHCFDTASLNELWAFIPNNLLYKLKKMKIVDPECGAFLNHHYFVDSSPVIHDVFIQGAWHTVAICGQGMGWGKDHQFYYFCLDVTDPLAPMPMWETTDDTMGETWSVPSVGKVDISGTPAWVAFMGSGYDTYDPATVSGDYFYVVDIETGQILKSFHISEQQEPASPFGIQNTLPASPNVADDNQDGMTESVYFGDLHGRFWKVDLTVGLNQWDASVLYRDPYYHPIITKPAVWVDTVTGTVILYFGTGGDEKAPNDVTYSFIALKDAGATGNVDWYLGPADLAVRLGIDSSLKKGEFSVGEKVWADDVIANLLVYIATLTGNIESLNPCLTLAGGGRIYSRHIQGVHLGGSALIGSGGDTVEYLLTAQKVRSAVTVGKTVQLTQTGSPTITKRLVFIQSYTQVGDARPEPPSEVLAQPISGYSRLKIKSWREVYRIIR
jgi:hypothetical protein